MYALIATNCKFIVLGKFVRIVTGAESEAVALSVIPAIGG